MARTTRAASNESVSVVTVRCSPPAKIRRPSAVIPNAERAGSVTPVERCAPAREAPEAHRGAALVDQQGRFWRTETTGLPGAGTPWCQAPMSVEPSD